MCLRPLFLHIPAPPKVIPHCFYLSCPIHNCQYQIKRSHHLLIMMSILLSFIAEELSHEKSTPGMTFRINSKGGFEVLDSLLFYGPGQCPPNLFRTQRTVDWYQGRLRYYQDKFVCYRRRPRDRQILTVWDSEWVGFDNYLHSTFKVLSLVWPTSESIREYSAFGRRECVHIALRRSRG